MVRVTQVSCLAHKRKLPKASQKASSQHKSVAMTQENQWPLANIRLWQCCCQEYLYRELFCDMYLIWYRHSNVGPSLVTLKLFLFNLDWTRLPKREICWISEVLFYRAYQFLRVDKSCKIKGYSILFNFLSPLPEVIYLVSHVLILFYKNY